MITVILQTFHRGSQACISCLKTTQVTAYSVTQVRFRKRRDVVPRRAPSKMYYVRRPVFKSKLESEILGTGNNHYRTQMKSLYTFLKGLKAPINFRIREAVEHTSLAEEQQDLQAAIAINDEWNAEIAKAREIRLTDEARKAKAIEEQRLTQELEKLELKQKRAKEVIDRKAARRENALDLENLEEELDKFFDSPVTNHNFAITKSGEKVAT